MLCNITERRERRMATHVNLASRTPKRHATTPCNTMLVEKRRNHQQSIHTHVASLNPQIGIPTSPFSYTQVLKVEGSKPTYLPLLDQEKVHRCISDDDEDAGKDSEADDVSPQGEGVEAKGAEDGGTGDFDVEAVAVVD